MSEKVYASVKQAERRPITMMISLLQRVICRNNLSERDD